MATIDLLDDLDNSLTFKCHTLSYPADCETILSKFKLKILNVNIRSINKNFSNFLVVLYRLAIEFDVIVLCECWININKSGGVVMYVNTKWSPVCSELEINDANCLLVEIPNSFKVLGLYRSPSFHNIDPFITSLDSAIESISTCPCLIFAGDININLLDVQYWTY